MFLNKLSSFDFSDKNDLTIYFISDYDLGSTTYDGNDLKMNGINFFWFHMDTRIDVSEDYIFLSDYIDMLKVTKNSNYSEQFMSYSGNSFSDIKVYEDTGKYHNKSFNVYIKFCQGLLSTHKMIQSAWFISFLWLFVLISFKLFKIWLLYMF